MTRRKADGFAGSMQFTYRNPYRSTHPNETLEGACTLVACAVSYAQDEPQPPLEPHARVAQYATSNARERLAHSLKETSTALRDAGWRSIALSDDNSLVDRAVAMRAGIGFYGKNALIINKELGSTILLGAVLTTAPLLIDADNKLEGSIDGCGTCTKCIPACPTKAIGPAGVINATECLSWIVQAPDTISEVHRIAMGNRIYGCDECQNACPYNKIQFRRAVQKPTRPAHIDLQFLLECSDEELLQTAGEWYVYKRDPRYLRRNALIIAGNTLKGSDATWELVSQWSKADDEMLCDAATWALSKRHSNT